MGRMAGKKASRTGKKAARMFEEGARQSAVARKLGVSRQCVHNWFWEWQGGEAALADSRRGGSGRRAKLDPERLADVDAALRRGPRAFGFTSERWTLWRVAAVIERVTGVRYHPSSVWRILRALGWSLRLPPKADRNPTGYTPRQWTAPGRRRAG